MFDAWVDEVPMVAIALEDWLQRTNFLIKLSH